MNLTMNVSGPMPVITNMSHSKKELMTDLEVTFTHIIIVSFLPSYIFFLFLFRFSLSP